MTKVLIVEDSRVIVTLIKKSLAPEGYDFVVATNGIEALELLQAGESPDIILCDIVMEKMDGFEFIETIKTQEATKDIPILFVTSRDTGEDINRGLVLGANDYIIKPFTKNEIINKVKSNLRN